jgi:ABC-2 type transport system ATP-binding protein
VIKNLAALGKTVLLTTHYMEEAQFLADRVAVIAAGQIVAEGPPATIGNREAGRARVRYRLPAGTSPPAGLGGPAGPDGFTEFSPADVTIALHQLTGWAIEAGARLEALEVSRPTLEDVYLSLTGGSAGDGDGERPARSQPGGVRHGPGRPPAEGAGS